MAIRLPLFTSHAGVTHELLFDEAAGTTHVVSTQDCSAILEANKAMANHNDGYSPSREMCRVAAIPMNLVYRIRAEEGWDPLSPHFGDRLKRMLNDSDWRHLRTGGGRV